jgi:mannose-6-phosphate isomerase
MAIALTPFRALCGFLPLPKIASYLRSTPEFAALIPGPTTAQFLSVSCAPPSSSSKAALESLFSALMTTDPPTVQKQLQALVSRYQSGGANAEEKDVVDLVLRLNAQFPGDIGVFCAFVLNYVHLNPGEAIFLGAGEPHAYVSGGTSVIYVCILVFPNCYFPSYADIMECMANSDNVIRAGLTPKLRDIPNLIGGLTYSSGPASQHAVQPMLFPQSSSRSSPPSGFSDSGVTSTVLYQPPVSEFSVLHTIVQRGDTETHRAIDGPSIAIVIEGRGFVRWGSESGNKLDIFLGRVTFIGAGTEIMFGAEDTSDGPLVVYRAFVEVV